MDSASLFELERETEYQTWLLGLRFFIPGCRLTSSQEGGSRIRHLPRPSIRRQPGAFMDAKVNNDATEAGMRDLRASGVCRLRRTEYATELHTEDVHATPELRIALIYGKKAHVVIGGEPDLKATGGRSSRLPEAPQNAARTQPAAHIQLEP